MKSEDKTVWIDGTLTFLVAMFVFMQGFLSGEESYKYCNPVLLYWLKFGTGSMAAGLGGLKAYRSTGFARRQREKADEKSGNTEIITRQ